MRKRFFLTSTYKSQNSPEIEFIIAGASYPYYFNFIPENEEEQNKNANNFNPFTTVYFSGVPPHENYKYVHNLLERLKHCGTVRQDRIDILREILCSIWIR